MLKHIKFTTFMLSLVCGASLMAAHQDSSDRMDSQTLQSQGRAQQMGNPSVGPFVREGAQFFINAEFLYWYANVSKVPAYIKVNPAISGSQANPGAVPVPLKSRDLNWEWDPGVRVGLGVIFDRDGWDLRSEWTYFHNSAGRSRGLAPLELANNGSPLVGSPFLLSPWAMNPGDIYNYVNLKYDLSFNQIDLVTGRRFWNSRYLSLRPFFGVRGYWGVLRLHVRSHLDANATGAAAVTVFRRDWDRMRQSSWGVGLLGGIDSNWYFAEHWSFAAKADVALVYGKVSQKRRINQLSRDSQNAVTEDLSSSYFHPSYAMLPMLDLALGMQWESLLGKNDRCYLSFLVGWESHFLFDYVYIDRNFEEQQGLPIFSADGSLILSGIVARATFQF